MTSIARWIVRAVAAGVTVWLAFAASAALATCQMQMIAEFPIIMDGNQPLVDVSINGRPARFLVDTGSAATILSRTAAADFGLQSFTIDGNRFYGVGGGDKVDQATIHEFKLGTATVHDLPLLVTGPGLRSHRFAGLLGEDFLSRADLELDFAQGVMRMIKPKDCSGDQVVYWRKAYSVSPIAPSNQDGKLEAYVALNGQRVLAEVDTGAYTSVVTTGSAEHAGVTVHSEGVQAAGVSGGVGAGVEQAYVAVFPTFSIGDETIKNAKLRIEDLFRQDKEVRLGSRLAEQTMNFPGMLLGADFIRAHRVYIARSQGKIYFSYNGGPIFQVMGRREQQMRPAVAAPAATPLAGAPDPASAPKP